MNHRFNPIATALTFRSVAGTLATAVALAAPLLPASALAATEVRPLPVIGGVTSIKLTSAATFAAGGVTIGVSGSTLFSPGSDGAPLVYFPITGGSLDTASPGTFGQIEHQGTGLSFSMGAATLSFSDFVIDTVGLQISAVLASAGNASAVIPLFTFSGSGNAAAPLLLALTASAAGAFTSVLGAPDLTGFNVGLANSVPITAAVPEPATLTAMLGGLGLLAWRVGRRRALA